MCIFTSKVYGKCTMDKIVICKCKPFQNVEIIMKTWISKAMIIGTITELL